MGRIVVRDAQWKDGTLAATMDWHDQNGKTLLVETRNMTFSGDAKLRAIDFQITLTAAVDVTFGDTKEGAFAIRLNDAFTEKKGAKIVDADGRAGHGAGLGQALELGGLHRRTRRRAAWRGDLRSPEEPAQSHLLARARLRPVRAQSVRPQRLRPETGGEPLEAARGSEA